jgi:hypothetical protein
LHAFVYGAALSMVTEKNLRNTIAVTMFGAKTPTKKAAVHSIDLMNRSMGFLRCATLPAPLGTSSPGTGVAIVDPYQGYNPA